MGWDVHESHRKIVMVEMNACDTDSDNDRNRSKGVLVVSSHLFLCHRLIIIVPLVILVIGNHRKLHVE